MSAPNASRRHASLREEAAADTSSAKEMLAGPTATSADLEKIYRAEEPGLTRYFRSKLRPGEDARDLVQEAFARLAGFMSDRSLARPAAYLQRIARNLLYDRGKRLETRLAPFHIPIGEGNEPAVAPDQELRIEAEDVMRVYLQALQELPERTREVFLLHRMEELSYREIGLALAISIPTVQYHVARALTYIDAALERG